MTFEPAALAAGTRPNQRKTWENLQGSPASVGTSYPTHSTTAWPLPLPGMQILPHTSYPQPHEATLDRMPTKQVLGLDWDLYFINADNTAAPDATHVCCSQPCKPCSPPSCQPPHPNSQALVRGVSPR